MAESSTEEGPVAENPGILRQAERQFIEEAMSILDGCAVGRDHPTHCALVAGQLAEPQLRALACQQWHFHRLFPTVLATLSNTAAGSPLEGPMVALAEVHSRERPDSPLRKWATLCSELGIGLDDLEGSMPASATTSMIEMQRQTARPPVGATNVALMVGVFSEASPWLRDRRRAFGFHYGVSARGLAYFGQLEKTPPSAESSLRQGLAALRTEEYPEALERLRDVLCARWEYFTEIGAAQ